MTDTAILTPERRQQLRDLEVNETTAVVLEEWFVAGYQRGYDLATSRAESRVHLALPIERD